MQAMVLLPEWDCGTCTAKQQTERGCVAPATKPVKLDGEAQLRCPRRVLLDEPYYLTEVFWLYSNYQNGILPEGGGLADQPNKLMETIRLLIVARRDADDEKAARETKRKAFRERVSQTIQSTGTP